MQTDFMAGMTSAVDQLLALQAAAAHDVGHLGVNNLFLEITKHELSTTYNDISILENMHVSLAFKIMRESPELYDWLSLLRDDKKSNRKTMVEMILATDMAGHKPKHQALERYRTMEKAKERSWWQRECAVETKEQKTAERLSKTEDHRLLLASCLHMADLGNACKPHDTMMAWTQRVLLEFYDQGEQEKQLGLPVGMLNDRSRFKPDQ